MKLETMSESTFKNYFSQSLESYTNSQMVSNFLTYEAAKSQVKQDLSQILPQGFKSPDHIFYNLINEDNLRVGGCWLQLKPEKKSAFLYDIIIDEEFRSSGYGAEAIEAIKKKCHEFSCQRLTLNVFGHNQGAQRFYMRQGFQVQSMQLNCSID